MKQDLIPDFIPVIGYIDDLIIVPLGILLVIKLIPPEIMAEHRDDFRDAQHSIEEFSVAPEGCKAAAAAAKKLAAKKGRKPASKKGGRKRG